MKHFFMKRSKERVWNDKPFVTLLLINWMHCCWINLSKTILLLLGLNFCLWIEIIYSIEIIIHNDIFIFYFYLIYKYTLLKWNILSGNRLLLGKYEASGPVKQHGSHMNVTKVTLCACAYASCHVLLLMHVSIATWWGICDLHHLLQSVRLGRGSSERPVPFYSTLNTIWRIVYSTQPSQVTPAL